MALRPLRVFQRAAVEVCVLHHEPRSKDRFMQKRKKTAAAAVVVVVTADCRPAYMKHLQKCV